MKNVLLVVAVNLLLLLAIPGLARHYAPPDKVINGKVTNEKGDPVDNATVQVKGSRTSTKTKSDGTYAISIASDSAVLVFSFVGYSKQEVSVTGKSALDVQLVQQESNLNEVIVVGYGTQKRSHLTGAVNTVEMKNIQDIPVGSLSEALKGQMPNVAVGGGYSRPGQAATITIRNPKTLSKDASLPNTPLFIIDDIMRTADDFNALDASEVESITVLKDAAAAIYGIKGGNGVVIVKTKRGKNGATAISYNGSYGIATASSFPKMMNGFQQATYLNDVNFSAGKQASDPAIYSPDELEYFKTHNYNWLDMAWQQSTETRQTVNLSGGSEKATYFAGLSYTNQNGNFTGTKYDRYTFRASSDIKLTTGLKLALSLSGNLSDNKQVYSKQGGESLDNDWKTLVTAPQFNPPTVNGLPILTTTATNSTIDNYNFFAIHNSNNFTETKNNALNFQGQLNYEIPFVKGLTAGVNFNKNITNTFNKQFSTFYNTYQFAMLGDHKHIYGGDVTRVVQLDNGNRVRLNPVMSDVYQLNTTINYSHRFGKHEISVLAAYEQSESNSDGVAGNRSGVILGALPNQGYATGAQTSDETQSQSGRLAYIGRVNYNYAGKYLAEVTYRADASGNFAPENRWGYFPSLSLGWVLSQERFFKNIIPKGVDFVKLRGSVGLLGTDNAKAYQYLASYALNAGKAPVFGGDNPRGLAIVASTAIPNRGVQWDDDTKINGGLDVKALESRLSVTIDGYWDHRYNQLANLVSAIPLVVGAAAPTENYGITNSFGYEISVGWKDRIGKDWSYSMNTFFSWSDNKVLKADFSQGLIGTFQDPSNRSDDPGLLVYHTLGMFRTQQQVNDYLTAHPGYTIFGQKPVPGMLYYEDVRGPQVNGQYTKPDGKITEADVQYVSKKVNNHYQMGFNWGVTYKTVTLSVLANLGFGGAGTLDATARSQATVTSNRPEFWADHWTPANTNASMPDPYQKDNYNVNSDFWRISSTTFSITNANLSYSLPQEWTKRAKLNGARIYILATNPLSFFNPYSYRGPLSSSYDVYPVLRSFAMGLNISL